VADVTVRMPRVDEFLPPAARAALLQQLAVLAVGRIKRRTKQGVDANGQRFKPYSEGYAYLRRRAGWQTSPPDLWLTGHMLGSMGVLEVTPEQALIGFSGSSPRVKWKRRERARKHRKTGERLTLTPEQQSKTIPNALKAYYNQHGRKPRLFFALSTADRAFLLRHALKEILRIVGQQSLSRAARR
jgi:hypothetical protein